MPAELAAIRATCAPRGIAVIEDACQAIGSRLHGRAVGTLGEFGCLSFFPTKNLGACGDGGAVVVGDAERAAQLRRLRVHGQAAKYRHAAIGLNSRLDEIQAAILRIKLRRLPARLARRAQIAARYDAAFEPFGLAPPRPPPGHATNHHQYTVRHPRRDALHEQLAAAGIDAQIHSPLATFEQPALAGCDGGFPVAAQLAREVISLPQHAELSDDDVDRVIAATVEFLDEA
jgi:dTDP-4-amino-4,6-dideoxygalactose transaminase